MSKSPSRYKPNKCKRLPCKNHNLGLARRMRSQSLSITLTSLLASNTQSHTNTKTDDHDNKLFKHSHDQLNRDIAIKQAELGIVQEPDEESVQHTDKNKRARQRNSQYGALLAALNGALSQSHDGQHGDHNCPADDVQDHADLDFDVRVLQALSGHVGRETDNTQDHGGGREDTEEVEGELGKGCATGDFFNGEITVPKIVSILRLWLVGCGNSRSG